MTKNKLKKILKNMRESIPESLEKELLDRYGNSATDDEGHVFEYTEQNIFEQLNKNKKLRRYEQGC